MNISGVTECELCEQVISEVVTSSTIPGVTEMVGNDIVCSECFDEARGEFQ